MRGSGPSERAPDGTRGSPGAEPGIAPQERFRRLALRYCPAWLRSDAEDVAQNAWLRYRRALEKNERNRDPGPSLLARMAYCATIDEVRKRRRRREVPLEVGMETGGSTANDPWRAARAREIGEGILACLAGLLPARRRAVALYLQGHSAPETGTLLGWSLKRCENMIFRGLADLRRCLARKGLRP